ncbi:MAG: UvrD-helicase domain-containing protein [Acutalibacteraceae bacterium]
MTPEEFTARYMPQFSEQQKAAVRETEGPVLLLAVPGSGKTTVLVTRLGYMALCRGIDPAHILAVTYTVAATREASRALYRALPGACRADAAVPHDQRPVFQDH